MRRQHNVFAATLLVLGIVYLCAQGDTGRPNEAFQYKLKEGLRPSLTSLGTEDSSLGKPIVVTHTIAPLAPTTSAFASLDDEHQSNLGFSDKFTAPESAGGQAVEYASNSLASEAPPLVQESNTIVPSSRPEYAFQNDLDLELPTTILERFSNHAPVYYDASGPKSYAYATFMATRNPSTKDPYFLAIQSLVHRILWSSRTRTQKNYPFIVFVADFVTQEQRTLLSGAGAIVRELEPLEWHCDADGVQKRWKDLFAKLNMWKEIEFERILFLDADAFPLTNIDEMLDITPVQQCVEERVQLDDFLPDRTPICESYIFAGVPQSPLDATSPNINVGSMVFTPSLRMHQRLVQNYLKTDHYDCAMAEQAFLNWQFSTRGAYPPSRLVRQWGGFFPKEDEGDQLKVVHEKIWVAKNGWMKAEWERGWNEMVEWYQSAEFAKVRALGMS